MTDTDNLREHITKVLIDNGCEAGNSIHSWRCEDGERFPGYCTCIKDLTDDLVPVIREALADAWDEGYDECEAPHFIDRRNPYRGNQS